MTKQRMTTIALLCGVLAMTGCMRSSQNVYESQDVGKASAVSFGVIVAKRAIDIKGDNSGGGALVGGAAGAGAGSYIGSGTGRSWGIGAGLVAGAVIGGLMEQAMSNRKGVEYTVTLDSGVTMTFPQNVSDKDTPLNVGDRVIVQNTGGYQRVLPAAHMPTEVKRPQGIKVVD
jgi:outer membrane lipoprotein SlyB